MTTCHPMCSWQCDDPQCRADCKAVPESPVCICTNLTVQPKCVVRCPVDMCEMQTCPACETVCEPNEACGAILCEQTVAAWACRKPACTYPTSELMCEQPACPYVGSVDPWATISKPFSWVWIVILCIVFLRLTLRFLCIVFLRLTLRSSGPIRN